jgi:hypothetical protein
MYARPNPFMATASLKWSRSGVLCPLLPLVAALSWNSTAVACPVEDFETPVERLATEQRHASESGQLLAYRSRIVEPNVALFAPEVLGPFEAGELRRAMLRSLADARRPERPRTMRDVERALALAMTSFTRTFPDFRCNFPIYLMDSLGRFDGAGRQVGGRPALVLGIDQITREAKYLPLRLFLAHELFHRYHGATSGFSDDAGEHQPIWRTLWAEGLATYASFRMTPGANIDSALIAPPRLAEKARPFVPRIARDLLEHLERSDHGVYTAYFTYGGGEAVRRGLPWRTGYYVGFLVAQDLARHHSLPALARLSGDALEREIETSLRRLAKGSAS